MIVIIILFKNCLQYTYTYPNFSCPQILQLISECSLILQKSEGFQGFEIFFFSFYRFLFVLCRFVFSSHNFSFGCLSLRYSYLHFLYLILQKKIIDNKFGFKNFSNPLIVELPNRMLPICQLSNSNREINFKSEKVIKK